LDGVGIGDIDRQDQRPPTSLLNLALGILEPFAATGQQGNGPAVLAEGGRCRASHAG
jgi:hypothetical protein